MSKDPKVDWSNATWEGSRRAQLRAALALTVRERLEAMEAICEVAERLATMPRRPAGSSASLPASRIPD
ncbi:MAG: hypothetical protein R3357_04130 [Burkholderiales bacterium]|nr:hypothetical protein [Burkholderiales bacterium]